MSDLVLDTIICADCLEAMRQMPSESIDIIITSPPYNLRNSTGGGFHGKSSGRMWPNNIIQFGYENHSDDMPYEEYVSWQQECLKEMYRLIKNDGAIFYNNKNRTQNCVLEDRSIIVKDLPVRQIIIWDRNAGINFNNSYFHPVTEQIYLICKPNFKLAKGANKHSDCWHISPESNNPHPAPFPQKLTDRIVASTMGNIYLDPFGGSGTVALSALKYHRHYILIDNAPSYCEMAKKRIEKAQKQCELSFEEEKYEV